MDESTGDVVDIKQSTAHVGRLNLASLSEAFDAVAKDKLILEAAIKDNNADAENKICDQ